LYLNEIIKEGVIGFEQQVVSKIVNRYIEQTIKSVAKIVGSSDLLGNPSKSSYYRQKDHAGLESIVYGSQDMIAAGSVMVSGVTSGINNTLSLITCDE
jgi:hypothetical protein